jgi:hypothetical protein
MCLLPSDSSNCSRSRKEGEYVPGIEPSRVVNGYVLVLVINRLDRDG